MQGFVFTTITAEWGDAARMFAKGVQKRESNFNAPGDPYACKRRGAGGAFASFPTHKGLMRHKKAAVALHSGGTSSLRKICGVFADEVPFSVAKEGFAA